MSHSVSSFGSCGFFCVMAFITRKATYTAQVSRITISRIATISVICVHHPCTAVRAFAHIAAADCNIKSHCDYSLFNICNGRGGMKSGFHGFTSSVFSCCDLLQRHLLLGKVEHFFFGEGVKIAVNLKTVAVAPAFIGCAERRAGTGARVNHNIAGGL